MKATEVFDVCHTRYRGLREWLADTRGAVRSVHLDTPSEGGYQWRPSRARACEYVADFERISRRALRRPEWKGRLRLFETYFLRGIEYRRAIGIIGVAEGTFDYWYQEVKRTLGAEFSRTGLFPPARYFSARNAASIPTAGSVARSSEEAARFADAAIVAKNRPPGSDVSNR